MLSGTKTIQAYLLYIATSPAPFPFPPAKIVRDFTAF